MKINICNNRNSKIIYTKWKMKQKRVRNLPWRNGSTTIAGKKLRSGRRWPEVVDGGRRVWWQWEQQRESALARETARERERQRDAKWRGLTRGGCTSQRWSQVVRDGQRWSEGVVAVGAAERERESARERDAKWWPEEEVAWWLHWPEDVDDGRRVWCSGERQRRERESYRGWRGEEEEGS